MLVTELQQESTSLVCPQCGEAVLVEQLLVFRPGGDAVHRTLYRCQRKAKVKDRCKVEYVDTPMSKAMEEPRIALKRCECGCGQPVAPGKRFASRQCLALHAQKFRKGRTRPSVEEEPTLEERNDEQVSFEEPSLEVAPPAPSSKQEDPPMAQLSNGILPVIKNGGPVLHGVQSSQTDTLEAVIEALRYLRALPRDVRQKTLELLEALEGTAS